MHHKIKIQIPKQEYKECKCGNRAVVSIEIQNIKTAQTVRQKSKKIGPFCNKCAKRHFELDR
jgi:aspartate carbamoyltransferase regulatory subunit